jgi:hypothetical protein
MKIFLSYSGAQRPLADALALSLRGSGHSVFYDRSAIEPGSEYDARIRNAIEDCGLFVFLISPESVAAGSYPLAEVGMAEKRWSHPVGHVLPIVAQRVPIKEIPAYLRAVSILEPRGDFVAESSAAVAQILRKRPGFRRPSILLAAAVFILLAWLGYSRIMQERALDREAANVADAARLEIDAGEYERAFNGLNAAAVRFPDSSDIRKERSRAAGLWVRNIRVRVGEQTFADVINTVWPVLAADAAATEGADAGDLLAHLGWCQYLKAKEGEDADPVRYFRSALDADKSNPFAHAMWGFWILFRHGPLSDATSHFNEAMVSGREHQWVRNLQIAGLLFYHDESLESEAIRIADTMHKEGLTVDQPERLWSIYEIRLLDRQGADSFLKTLPAGSSVTVFQWLYPESSVPQDRLPLYRYILGRLREVDGNREGALSAFRWTGNYLQERKFSGRLLDRTLEGIRRLTNGS